MNQITAGTIPIRRTAVRVVERPAPPRWLKKATKRKEKQIRWKRIADEILNDKIVYKGKACTDLVFVFRKNAEKIIRWSKQGKRMIMTYRSCPVMCLEPIQDNVVDKDGPFLQLDGIAAGKKENLNNQEMDKIIYGQ